MELCKGSKKLIPPNLFSTSSVTCIKESTEMALTKINVKALAIKELVQHIGQFKEARVQYPITDIRCMSLKEIGKLPRAKLWQFLLRIDPELYGAWGTAPTDRRRPVPY